MTVEIRRSSERFSTRDEGRLTRHSFSFGGHYDPDNVGFGPLVCFDDHRLRAGTGFDEHPHSDVEIVTWVLEGAVDHADTTGRAGIVRPGTVQVQSAGSGIVHRETAASGVGPTRFVQAWLTPDETGTEPAYTLAEVALPEGELVPVASGHRDDAAARIGTASATFWVARLPAGGTLTLPDEPRQHVFVGRGALIRSSLAEPLGDGDAFRITDRPGLELTAAVPTELLVWTFTR
ncbi:pirin family protein [Nocardioides sp. MAHUQ-72]|uniref:pirin family protein n=1 Tax=unclassified Nocardioides TaxID=2615069 RepID=UPI00360A13AC